QAPQICVRPAWSPECISRNRRRIGPVKEPSTARWTARRNIAPKPHCFALKRGPRVVQTWSWTTRDPLAPGPPKAKNPRCGQPRLGKARPPRSRRRREAVSESNGRRRAPLTRAAFQMTLGNQSVIDYEGGKEC